MYQGITLDELLEHVVDQAITKVDVKVPLHRIEVRPPERDGGPFRMALPKVSNVPDVCEMTQRAHQQLAEILRIPGGFYRQVQADAPDVLANMINGLALARRVDTPRMIRTVRGAQGQPVVRAIMSDRYRRYDNDDLLMHLIPLLRTWQTTGDVVVESCELNDSKLYLKVRFPKTTAEVAVGDVVQSGAAIGNSEVGDASLYVLPLSWRLTCRNGAMHEQAGTRKRHVGRREDESLEAILTQETLNADDHAFWLKVRDLVRSLHEPAWFEGIVDSMRANRATVLDDPMKGVEILAQRYNFTEAQSTGVLSALLKGGDISIWGLGNAVTYHAQHAGDYEEATMLERIGGQVLTLDPSQYHEIGARPLGVRAA